MTKAPRGHTGTVDLELSPQVAWLQRSYTHTPLSSPALPLQARMYVTRYSKNICEIDLN